MINKKILTISVVSAIAILLSALVFWAATQVGKNSARIDEDRQNTLVMKTENLSKGSKNSDIAIVEYIDILCPHCAKAHEEIVPKIEGEYINEGKASYEIRLVAKIAPDSKRAAKGAYCAAEQDMFWRYLDTAYRTTWNDYYSQNKDPEEIEIFSESNIHQFAYQVIGLDNLTWSQCLKSDKYDKILEENEQEMRDLKAYGTPHFIINGHDYNGAPPYEFFKTAIETELRRKAEEG